MVSGHQRLALQSWPVKLFTEPHYIYVSEADVCPIYLEDLSLLIFS